MYRNISTFSDRFLFKNSILFNSFYEKSMYSIGLSFCWVLLWYFSGFSSTRNLEKKKNSNFSKVFTSSLSLKAFHAIFRVSCVSAVCHRAKMKLWNRGKYFPGIFYNLPRGVNYSEKFRTLFREKSQKIPQKIPQKKT